MQRMVDALKEYSFFAIKVITFPFSETHVSYITSTRLSSINDLLCWSCQVKFATLFSANHVMLPCCVES